MLKIPVYFRYFRQIAKFLIIPLVSLTLLRKLKGEIRRLIFGGFLTVKNIQLLTFDYIEIMKILGQRIALLFTALHYILEELTTNSFKMERNAVSAFINRMWQLGLRKPNFVPEI